MTAMHQQQQLHRKLPPPQQQQIPNGQFHYRQQQQQQIPGGSQIPVDSFSSSSGGSSSPSLSLRTATAEDSLSTLGYPRMVAADCESGSGTPAAINLQIFVPELQMQKCLSVPLDELVWDIKRRLLESLPQQLPQHFNFGLFLPPCDGRAGKFLLEDRPIRDYPFHDCVPYVELKYKKRVYKMLRLDEKALRSVHSKANLRKFAEAVQQKNAQKVERLCTQGLDPNFHDPHGETPLTLASGIPGNRQVLVQLVGGGAHLDFRNTEGQTGMHKAAFLSLADNVRALLELGASPNYRDLIGLTPLYYAMLTPESSPEVAEMLLAEAADLDIVDMHGNTALHQACKNGLAKQAELLLYYGADLNARNVNGNSPLHVCAVNGRVDCAQVLLYRGADPTLLNRQGQTAVAVAQIVGLVGMPVADVIKGHSPHNIVPFREAPKLNPRRRLSSRQFSVGGGLDGTLRRRSLSHCSSSSTIASSQQQQQHRMSANAYGQQAISPSPSMASSATDYGTLRRIPAEAVQHQQPGLELNVPRILVIPRGPKGFGFILRGARHVDSLQMDFRPSATAPALQFFEGVDMQGMAMRAGLRPGDFLLEINGVDVRAASHEQVVQLIHQSGDTITLKVITVDLELLAREQGQQQQQPQIYATTAGASTGNYATLGRRNHSVPRTAALNNGGPITTNGNGNGQSGMPPQPPQRNPSTTLSFGRAFTTNGGAAQFSTADISPVSASSSSSSLMHQQPPPLSTTTPSMAKPNPTTTATTSAEHSHPLHPSSYPIPPPFPVPSAAQSHQQQQQQIRCASVKVNRTSAVRRISAAELEHLMVQQGSSSSQQQQSIVLGPEQPNGGGGGGAPRKFTSVTEMKRRKQNLRANSVSVGADEPNGLYGSPLKNCNSTPDLLHQQGQSEFRPVLRPKTPPPPPPPVGLQKQAAEPAEPELQPIYASTVCVVPAEPQTMAPASGPATSSSSATCGPPAPPPPPPPDFLLRPSQPSPASTPNQQPQLRTTEQQQKAGNAESTAAGADCRGISADALRSVRLKPVASKAADEQPKRPALKTTAATSGARNGGKDNEKPKIPMPADFDSDLRSALAKRRIKVRGGEDGSGGESSTEDAATASVQQTVQSKAVVSIAVGGGGQARKAAEPQQSTAAAASQPGGSSSVLAGSRYTGGLSLRESVLENVSGVAGKAGGGGHGCVHKTAANSHSPPGGFIGTKKDSGYTSSRTSLEPSECGDCCEHHLLPTAGGTQAASLPVQHRVNVISQQLMDQQQTPLVGRLSPKQAPRFLEHQPTALVRIPPVDYEEHSEGGTSSIDSGNLTDLDQQTTAGGSSSQASVEESEFADGQQQSGSQTPSANSSPSAAANDGFHNLEPHQGRGRPSSQFRQRPISDWAPEDVSDWLRELELGEHCPAFATVRGTDLLRFDRARYTALGVTRIGHRQKMEQSLRAMQRE